MSIPRIESEGAALSALVESKMKTSTYNLNEGPQTKILHSTTLDIYNEPHDLRRSGIVCTIGRVTQEVEQLKALMEAGLDVVRLNFSHGTHESHQNVINNAREAARQLGRDICIALDTKGPEIRTGNFITRDVNGKDSYEYILEQNSRVRISVDEADHDTGNAEKFFVDYKNLPKVVRVGDLVYIDDGLVSLRVAEIPEAKDGEPMFVDCIVENSGAVSNHKGVNLPNVEVDLPAISEKDRNDLAFGVQNDVDLVFASFIRKPEDVLQIRQCLVDAGAAQGKPKVGKRIKIISKIENHEGVQKFDQVLEVTDGVMVARGDLGIEIPPEKVFLAQKMMISKCNLANKPIIVATQMLESMKKNPRPTRAEVSDVANAVLDGADCVMLSGETASGGYPVESVTIMARICKEAESAVNPMANFLDIRGSVPKPFVNRSESVCCAAVLACFEQQAKMMIVLSNSGTTARIVAKYRPPCPILAVVKQDYLYTVHQLRITSGVYGVTCDDSSVFAPEIDESSPLAAQMLEQQQRASIEYRVEFGIDCAKQRGWAGPGDCIVCVHADKQGLGFANMMRIIYVE